MFESNPHPMWVYDLQSLRFLAVNNAAIMHYGYTREEFLAMTIADIRPPEDITRLIRNVKQLKNGVDKTGVWRHRKKNGELILVETTSHTIDLPVFKGGIVLVNDITERAKAENDLRRSEQNLSVTLDSIGDGVIATDKKGCIVRMNPVAEQLTGWALKEAAGTHINDILNFVDAATREKIPGSIDKVLNDSAVTGLSNNTLLIGRNEKERHVAYSAAPIRESDGDVIGAVLVFQDVTERYYLEEQLRQSQKMEIVGRLAGGIAHDFNNLLTPILSYADLLLQDPGLSDRFRQDLKGIKEAAERARDLVGQLLAFSRKQVLRTTIVDLNSIISAMQSIIFRLVTENIHVNFNLTPVGKINADPSQIEQIILNLVVNAKDAMESGGILTISTSVVEMSADDPILCNDGLAGGEYVRLSVSDTGCGMDGNTLRRVFEPFFTTKEHGKGTGLGLATVYGIVKQHKGAIKASSAPGSGAEFAIYLPVVYESVSEKKASPERNTELSAGSVILFVEDDTMVRTPVCRILQRCGFKVIEAGNGEEAMAVVRGIKTGIDLLVTDMMMPGINGRELYKCLKRQVNGLRVLYISGYTEELFAESDLLNNSEFFLQKPFSIDEFISTISTIIKMQGTPQTG